MLLSIIRFIGMAAVVFSFFGMHVQAASVNVPEKLPECPVKFIRGILADSQGAIWAVGERESIYRLDVKNGAYEKSWVNVNYSSSFPRKANFTCIAEDRQGRVWVGTDDCGVAVFNGQGWKMYDRSNALNGEHVYAIAVSPVSGEVAVATSGGVALYDPAGDSWQMLDRSTGMTEDQAASRRF